VTPVTTAAAVNVRRRAFSAWIVHSYGRKRRRPAVVVCEFHVHVADRCSFRPVTKERPC